MINIFNQINHRVDIYIYLYISIDMYIYIYIYACVLFASILCGPQPPSDFPIWPICFYSWIAMQRSVLTSLLQSLSLSACWEIVVCEWVAERVFFGLYFIFLIVNDIIFTVYWLKVHNSLKFGVFVGFSYAFPHRCLVAGAMASRNFKTLTRKHGIQISDTCKSPLLKYVVSHRRQLYVILKNRNKELNLCFHVRVYDNDYVFFATSSGMKCFGCGEEGLGSAAPRTSLRRPAAVADPTHGMSSVKGAILCKIHYLGFNYL